MAGKFVFIELELEGFGIEFLPIHHTTPILAAGANRQQKPEPRPLRVRAYTIASAPQRPEAVQICVRVDARNILYAGDFDPLARAGHITHERRG